MQIKESTPRVGEIVAWLVRSPINPPHDQLSYVVKPKDIVNLAKQQFWCKISDASAIKTIFLFHFQISPLGGKNYRGVTTVRTMI